VDWVATHRSGLESPLRHGGIEGLSEQRALVDQDCLAPDQGAKFRVAWPAATVILYRWRARPASFRFRFEARREVGVGPGIRHCCHDLIRQSEIVDVGPFK
jgi:hypothetical protein